MSAEPATANGSEFREELRTLVVISREPYFPAHLINELDRGNVLILAGEPDDAASLIGRCDPYPWMLVSDVAELPEKALAALAASPIIPIWFRAAPIGAPEHTRVVTGSPDRVVETINSALTNEVGGMRLAPTTGVAIGAEYVDSAALEALIGMHPHHWSLPIKAFRSASALLARHSVPLRVAAGPTKGSVVLAESDRSE